MSKAKSFSPEAVLLKAADIIERDGLCKGDYHRNGHHCSLGALEQAEIELGASPSYKYSGAAYPLRTEAGAKALVMLATEVPGGTEPSKYPQYVNPQAILSTNISEWNDRSATRKLTVTRALRRAAQ